MLQITGVYMFSTTITRLEFFNYREFIVLQLLNSFGSFLFVWFWELGIGYDLRQMLGVEYHIPHMINTKFAID